MRKTSVTTAHTKKSEMKVPLTKLMGYSLEMAKKAYLLEDNTRQAELHKPCVSSLEMKKWKVKKWP